MKQLLPVLLLLLLGACSEKVEVTIIAPQDWEATGWEMYGVDTVQVWCDPARKVSYVELLIDSVVAGVDTYPDPTCYTFQWDVRQLLDGSVYRVQARAISGSHEYLSSELLATVGFRSRLVADGPTRRTHGVYLPDGKLRSVVQPFEHFNTSYHRLGSGCHSIVLIADYKLYEGSLEHLGYEVLDSMESGIYSCDASPVSDLVAFEGYPAGIGHLFTVDSFGHRVQLTHDCDSVLIDSSQFTCIENSSPVFSPDGSKLAYFRKSKCLAPGDPREREAREDAFVMNSDGTNPVNLTASLPDAYFSGFTWTFDGKWVLFRAGVGHPDAVLAANMDGRTITGLEVYPMAMACSPVDSTLAYIRADSEHRLYTVKLVWTADTLYVGGVGSLLGGEPDDQRRYIDWVEYSRE